jgi:adenine-specific DNA methylase
LPANETRKDFLELLGIPADVDLQKAQDKLVQAKASGIKLQQNPFFWKRAFEHVPTEKELSKLTDVLEEFWGVERPLVVDPMAGGGSIPFEAMRLGLPVVAGDLNPVAFICLKGTLEYPARFGRKLLSAVECFCREVNAPAIADVEKYFPQSKGETIYRYLWARTIHCTSCGLKIPLAPNWWILHSTDDSKNMGMRLRIPEEGEECDLEIVENPIKEGIDPEKGTVKGGRAECPRCFTVISGEEIKHEAQNGKMGQQVYAISIKKRAAGHNRASSSFRTLTKEDQKGIDLARVRLEEMLPIWESQGMVPIETVPEGLKTREPLNFGMTRWCDFFSSRQLLVHLTYLDKFRQVKSKLFEGKKPGSEEWDFAVAVSIYGAMVFDACLTYNCRLARWAPDRGIIKGSMDMQAFPFRWSYVESGHPSTLWPWAMTKVLDALGGIVNLLPSNQSNPQIYCGAAAKIPLEGKSVPCIIVDPPYAENVMYAEISDFFYVWLKRLIADLFVNEFKPILTEKDEEAVANPARFRGMGKSAKELSQEDYKTKMEACFREMNRTLQDDGVMTVMFTHRTAEAWSSLATALMNSDFTFVSSWPVHTEPPDKFAKRGKGVLKVTVLLTCRKRKANHPGIWEHIIEELRGLAKQKIEEFTKLGISGPDLKVSVYAPVLGKFADYYPVKTATGKEIGPQQALDLVVDVLNEKFLQEAGIQNADKETAAYINLLATFPTTETEYEEARLATVFGGLVTLDTLDVKGTYGFVEKDGKNIKILSARDRQALGIIDPYDTKTLKTTIDHVHAAILQYERDGLIQVKRLMQEKNLDTAGSPFPTVLQAYARYAESSSNESFQKDAAIAKALLAALGKSIEFAPKKGERLDHYTSES